jgi:predicted RNA binding protein YcfA (HicA-like mRNA interferase family)
LGKLKVLSGKELCAILSQHGFLQVRQKGSHIIMQKKSGDTTTTVPVPQHKEIRMALYSQSFASVDYQDTYLKINNRSLCTKDFNPF